MDRRGYGRPRPQDGAEIVEFALVSLIFFTFIFAFLEFGRLLYLYNTMQEVSRRAAREAVVRWTDQGAAVKTLAMFGAASVPAGPEITAANITITYLQKNGNAVTAAPVDAGDNIAACGDTSRAGSCIDSVLVTIDGVHFAPMTPLFTILGLQTPPTVSMPTASVRMHAESLGFDNSSQ